MLQMAPISYTILIQGIVLSILLNKPQMVHIQ